MPKVAIAVERAQRRCFAMNATAHVRAKCEESTGRSMVGTAALILARASSEFGVRQYQRAIPQALLAKRRAQRND